MTENDVKAWLEAHPDALVEHPDWLDFLKLPNDSDLPSLMQAQVERLRADKADMIALLEQLRENAQDNEALTRRIHALTLSLMAVDTEPAFLQTLADQLRDDFGLDGFHLHLFHGDEALTATPLALAHGSNLPPWAQRLLDKQSIECGRLTREKLSWLFPSPDPSIASAAVIPLKDVGLLAIGSGDEQRFQAGSGTLFLELLGQTVCFRLGQRNASARKSA